MKYDSAFALQNCPSCVKSTAFQKTSSSSTRKPDCATSSRVRQQESHPHDSVSFMSIHQTRGTSYSHDCTEPEARGQTI